MKHKVITAFMATLLLLTAATTPSCIGSFALSNRLLNWNKNVGNKFLNELVFFAFWILPVYEVCGLADVVVLNSIEFWSGNNPVGTAKADKVVEGNDGRYIIKSDQNGYDVISCNDGSKMRFDFNKEEQSWSVTANGKTNVLFSFVDANHVRVPVADGWRTVEISQDGVYAYQQMIDKTMFATR